MAKHKAGTGPCRTPAEGFAVQRPSKAAVGILRLLRLSRGAQNVPRSSFEAQEKQLVGPGEVAENVSKPNRNSLWGLGRYHGKAGGTPSQAAAEGLRFKGLRKLLRGF